MILYLRNPKNSTKKLLEIRNSFGKVAEYKINQGKIPFTIDSKTIKYLEIYSTKDTKDLLSKNYKPLEERN
jgi:hypothetical protein